MARDFAEHWRCESGGGVVLETLASAVTRPVNALTAGGGEAARRLLTVGL